MSADPRLLKAQHDGRLLDLARENRDLRAEVVRREKIIVAVREVREANFARDSLRGRLLDKALGDTP